MFYIQWAERCRDDVRSELTGTKARASGICGQGPQEALSGALFTELRSGYTNYVWYLVFDIQCVPKFVTKVMYPFSQLYVDGS